MKYTYKSKPITQSLAREPRKAVRSLTKEEEKKACDNRMKLLKRVIMSWTPKKCRERIEVVKRAWSNPYRTEEIAIIREHLRSIGKD